MQKLSMRLLAVVLLSTVLIVGCENRTSSPGEETGNSEVVKGVEVAPENKTAHETANEAAVDAGQPVEREQSDPKTAAEKVLPAAEEKPLVIISENPVFADTGQLLEEVDKELEVLLDTLEAMDDIQAEELNF